VPKADWAAAAAKAAKNEREHLVFMERLKREAPELYTKYRSGVLDLRETRQHIKEKKKRVLVEQIKCEPKPLPEGPFRVQTVDPPWKYDARAEDITHRARNPYPDMTVDEIKALPVAERAHPDGCVLWLWTTNAFMRQAFDILDAWGFENKTILTWVKDKMGTGDWLRGKTEHCLMAIKGKPIVTLTNQTTALFGPLREHSRKPDEFYALVDSLCPGNKAEWFARTAREGWTPIMSGELEKFGAIPLTETGVNATDAVQ